MLSCYARKFRQNPFQDSSGQLSSRRNCSDQLLMRKIPVKLRPLVQNLQHNCGRPKYYQFTTFQTQIRLQTNQRQATPYTIG